MASFSRRTPSDEDEAAPPQFDPSRLPTDAFHGILSLLSRKEAARACLVSKGLLRAWRGRPFLSFDYEDFRGKPLQNSLNPGRFEAENQQAFVNFVNRTMVRYRGKERLSIQRFDLRSFLEYDIEVSLIDRWIETAIEKGVSKLSLNVFSLKKDVDYNLPQRIFEAKSLVDFSLIDGKLEQDVGISVMWHQLRRLHLWSVKLENGMLQKIISCCQLLEFLKIDGCECLTVIKVSEHKTLKEHGS